jgi:2-dehydro-3-deoxyphosphogluconate aldolase/(4S)-4-hydroxy-2-oxoglutarate aldolase
MTRSETCERIRAGGVIAIVRLDHETALNRVVDALVSGGVDVIEVTMTTPGALEQLSSLSSSYGDSVLLGAGTVLDAASARAAILAGARFIVAPTLSREVIETCSRCGIASLPGAFTPTEILKATEMGADFVKVFPSSVLGPGYFKDVLAPLPDLALVPTGGVSASNARAYLEAGAAAIGVGSSLVSRSAVAKGDFDSIAVLAAEFRKAVSLARGAVQ